MERKKWKLIELVTERWWRGRGWKEWGDGKGVARMRKSDISLSIFSE